MELSNRIAEHLSNKYKSKITLGGPIYQLMRPEAIHDIIRDVERLGWAVYGGPPTKVEVNSCLDKPYDSVISVIWGTDIYYIRVKYS